MCTLEIGVYYKDSDGLSPGCGLVQPVLLRALSLSVNGLKICFFKNICLLNHLKELEDEGKSFLSAGSSI